MFVFSECLSWFFSLMGYSKRNSKCWYLFKTLLGKKSGKKAITHKWYQDLLKIDVQILQNWKHGTFFTENIIFRNVLNIRYPSHSPYFRLTLKRPLGTAIRPARRVRLHASIVIKGACVNASITITWIQSNFKIALPNQTIPPVTKAEGRKPLQHERIHAAFSLSQLSVTVSKCMSACVFVGICHLCRVHLLAFQGSKQVSSYFTWSKGWAYDSFTEVVKLESNKVSVMFISHLLFCIIRHDVQHNCWTCPYSVLLIVF